MFGNRFYHQSTRKYVAMFGTLFNDIVISRVNNAGNVEQRMKVPIHYAPMQKILAKVEQDASLDAPAMTLPRMSFEITNLTFSPERKLPSLNRNVYINDANSKKVQYVPAPYDLDFQLNIMTKYTEDGTKILEQILPFFKPDVTVSVKLVDEMDLYLDVPIILNSVTTDDSYEGDFLTRRVLTWTLNFTVRAYYFGPVSSKKVIKFVESNVRDINSPIDSAISKLTAQPGLTAAGLPTNILQGERATATTSVANGQVVSADIIVNGGGYGYRTATATIAPPVLVTAVAGVGVTGDSVSTINVTNGGGFYTTPPTVTFGIPSLPGQTAQAYVTIDTDDPNTISDVPFNSNTEIGYAFTTRGRYYIEPPTVTFEAPPASIQATASATNTANTISFTVSNGGTNYVSADATVEYEVLSDTVNFSLDSFFTDENISLIGTNTIALSNTAPVGITSEPFYLDDYAKDQKGVIVIKVPDGSEMTANTDYPIYNGRFYNIGLRKEDNGDINLYHELDSSVPSYVTLDPDGYNQTFRQRGLSFETLNSIIGEWAIIGIEYRKTDNGSGTYQAAVSYKDTDDTYEKIGVRGLQYRDFNVVIPIWPFDLNNLTITAPPGSKIEYFHLFQDLAALGTAAEVLLGIENAAFPGTDVVVPDVYPGPIQDISVYYTDFEDANTTTETAETSTTIDNFSINSIASVTDSNIVRVNSVSIDAPTAARTPFALAQISNGRVTGLNIQDKGFGYYFINDSVSHGVTTTYKSAEITFEAPTGSASAFAATGTANVVNGAVVDVDITNAGQGYNVNTPPTITFSAPVGRTATATVAVNDETDEVGSITITDGGQGYTEPATITISEPDEISIDYNDINEEDDWGFIVQVEDDI